MRAFSGIKPSGDLHIGNYFGSIAQWVKGQGEYEGLYCVVDQHAITVPQKPEELHARTLLIAAVYLAAGIDPVKNILFIQSHVPEHTELAWMFNCVVRMSELKRMTQYKDKVHGFSLNDEEENVSVGLFDYPVLMAADILLYGTDIVPVGHDQVQHVELTCDIANRFNRDFGAMFKIPKAVLQTVGARIMSLDDPTKKMSKSEKNTVMLMDPEDVIRKKISRAVTDSVGTIEYAPKERPGISNLIEIYHHASGKPIADIVAMYAGKGYKDFKQDLGEHLVQLLLPLQAKVRGYLEHPAELEKILRDGAERARTIARKTLAEAKQKVGFVQF